MNMCGLLPNPTNVCGLLPSPTSVYGLLPSPTNACGLLPCPTTVPVPVCVVYQVEWGVGVKTQLFIIPNVNNSLHNLHVPSCSFLIYG